MTTSSTGGAQMAGSPSIDVDSRERVLFLEEVPSKDRSLVEEKVVQPSDSPLPLTDLAMVFRAVRVVGLRPFSRMTHGIEDASLWRDSSHRHILEPYTCDVGNS